MANVKSQKQFLYHRLNAELAFLAPFLILVFGPHYTRAQLQHPPTDAAPSMAAPTFFFDPTDGDNPYAASSASASNSALPSSTDGAEYATHDNNSSPDTGVLNYYFLLLAVFVIVLAIVWWTLARRRRKRNMHLRNNRQTVLSSDLETWTERIAGRWRSGGRESREEEGLDERGEAPPPYLKEPEQVHHTDGPGMELHDLSRREAKPPDYSEASVRG